MTSDVWAAEEHALFDNDRAAVDPETPYDPCVSYMDVADFERCKRDAHDAARVGAISRRDRKRELRRTYGPATPLLRLQGRLTDLANIARHRVIDCSALAVELDAAAAEVMTILEAIAAE